MGKTIKELKKIILGEQLVSLRPLFMFIIGFIGFWIASFFLWLLLLPYKYISEKIGQLAEVIFNHIF